MGDKNRLREGWEDPGQISRYYGNQEFGCSLPSPYRGRDKVRTSRLGNTIKDKNKGWVGRKG